MKRSVVSVGTEIAADANQIAVFVQKANEFVSSVHLETETAKVNAKSIMGMLAMSLDTAGEVVLITDGGDEQEAFDALAEMLCRK